MDRRARLELKAQAVLHSLTDEFLELAIEQLGALRKRGVRPDAPMRHRWRMGRDLIRE